MTTFTTIANRPLRIIGWPCGGWRASDGADSSSHVVALRFAITNDGADGFRVVSESLDGVFCADSWSETLAEAFAAVQRCFGIARAEWDASTFDLAPGARAS